MKKGCFFSTLMLLLGPIIIPASGSGISVDDIGEPIELSVKAQTWGSSYGDTLIHYGEDDLCISSDGGETWLIREVELESRYCAGPSYIHRITLDGDMCPSLNYSRSSDDAATWSQTTVLAKMGGPNHHILGIYYLGSSLIVYFDDHSTEHNALKFMKSVDNGSNWSDPVIIDDKFWSIYPAPISIVEWQGKLLVAYTHDDLDYPEYSGEVVLMESGDGGNTWSNRRVIARNALDPQMESGDGRLYLTYFSHPDDVGIKFITSTDGQRWSSPKTVGRIQFHISFTWIFSMVVKDGKVFLSYTKDNLAVPGPPENKCKINISSDGGDHWQEVVNSTFSPEDSLAPTLLISGGRLHFFWINETRMQTMYRRFIFDRSYEDSDDDGINDVEDAFPSDPKESEDSDRDGIGENADAFPSDPSASIDTDKDGHPDIWNPGKSQSNSTTGLKLDQYPNDKKRWNDPVEVTPMWLIPSIAGILTLTVAIIAVILILMKRNKK